jgi:Leucine-rich repeat (LRR) protein
VQSQILECSYSDCFFKKSLQSLEDEQAPIDFSLYSTEYFNKVESITFDYASIYQLTSNLLTKLPNLSAISAKKAGIKKINRGLFGAQNGGNLKHLLLSNNVMERVDNFTFMGARQLETLDLSYNMIAILESDAFKGLHELSILNLAHNLLTQIDTSLFLQTEVLYNVDLSENLLVAFNFDMFTNIKRYQFVALNNNKITEISASEINHSVVVLDLSSNPLEEKDSTVALYMLKNVISLRHPSNVNPSSYDYEPILNLSYYNTLVQK